MLDSQMTQEHAFLRSPVVTIYLSVSTPFQLIVTSSLPPLGKLDCPLTLAAWHWLGTEIANAFIFAHLHKVVAGASP